VDAVRPGVSCQRSTGGEEGHHDAHGGVPFIAPVMGSV
jgi:hypothetical protein